MGFSGWWWWPVHSSSCVVRFRVCIIDVFQYYCFFPEVQWQRMNRMYPISSEKTWWFQWNEPNEPNVFNQFRKNVMVSVEWTECIQSVPKKRDGFSGMNRMNRMYPISSEKAWWIQWNEPNVSNQFRKNVMVSVEWTECIQPVPKKRDEFSEMIIMTIIIK